MSDVKANNPSDSDDEDDDQLPPKKFRLPSATEQPQVISTIRRPSSRYILSVRNTFSPSCVVVSSRIIVVVSMIFALVESVLFGLVIVSFYGLTGLLLVSCFVYVILLAGERYRINCSLKWWRNSTQTDVESCRAYEVTTTWIKNTTLTIIFLIVPIWVVSIFFVYSLTNIDEVSIPASLIVFVLITGIDLGIFIPFCACPTAIYAACDWKRVVKDEERMECF